MIILRLNAEISVMRIIIYPCTHLGVNGHSYIHAFEFNTHVIHLFQCVQYISLAFLTLLTSGLHSYTQMFCLLKN